MTRWTRRLLAGAIAILVPALAGCEAGLNAPTLEFHQASFGNSATVNGITVDDAFVLAPGSNSALQGSGQAGVFMSLYAQNSDQLTKVTAPGTASSVQLVNGPVTLNANSLVDLSGPSPRIVLNGLTSSLSGGQTVTLDLTFATAGQVTVQVPVEPDSYEFATYSPPPPSPTASLSSSAKHRHRAKAKPDANASASVSPAPLVPATPSATS